MRTPTQARPLGLLAAGVLVVAGALLVAACGSSPAKHRGAQAGRAECSPKALRAVPDSSVSAPTDQLLLVFVLRNVTPVACSVQASPRIALYSQRGAELPFDYRNSPAAAARRLTIAGHSRVFFVITKHPCTLQASAGAMSMGLDLSRGTVLHLRLDSAGALFDYCGAKDPSGHVVHVLPLERTMKTLVPGA